MKLLADEDPFCRNLLVVDRLGVHILYQRHRVGGGWYVRERQTVRWPWRRR